MAAPDLLACCYMGRLQAKAFFFNQKNYVLIFFSMIFIGNRQNSRIVTRLVLFAALTFAKSCPAMARLAELQSADDAISNKIHTGKFV